MENKIDKIFIANRGEIAVRIIRACKKLGIESVVAYTKDESCALHVELADEAYVYDDLDIEKSYLSIEKTIDLAVLSKAKAVHPGYGLLSESSEFAKSCKDNGLIFIGPDPKSIDLMGQKTQAKELASKIQVPTIPGYKDSFCDIETLIEEGKKIGYPYFIKASYGGGGRGMKLVEKSDELQLVEFLTKAKRDAKLAFGKDDIYLEKYLPRAKHVEIQILADQHGNVIHLFERDCSVQRRHQKIIEETPCVQLPSEVLNEMTLSSLKLAKEVNYQGVGTVEFLWVPGTNDYYFLEMNTRLQVEHPVTEMTCSIDLVEWQIKVAAGMPLPFTQNEIKRQGHSIECRLYSEDANQNFIPCLGNIDFVDKSKLDQSIRLDEGFKEGDQIGVRFDPLMAKIISHGRDRQEARTKLILALKNFTVLGVTHNSHFLSWLLHRDEFQEGSFYTQLLDEILSDYRTGPLINQQLALALGAYLKFKSQQYPGFPIAWRTGKQPWLKNSFKLNNEVYEVCFRTHQYFGQGAMEQIEFKNSDGESQFFRIVSHQENQLVIEFLKKRMTFYYIYKNNDQFHIKDEQNTFYQLKWIDPLDHGQTTLEKKEDDFVSKMPGVIQKVYVEEGDNVKEGDELVVLEAMKMENKLYAPRDGQVERILVQCGQCIDAGVKLIQFKSFN